MVEMRKWQMPRCCCCFDRLLLAARGASSCASHFARQGGSTPKRNRSSECLKAPLKLMAKAKFKLLDKLAAALGHHGDLNRKHSKPKHNLLRTLFKSKSYEVVSCSIVVICVVITVLDPPVTEALIPLTFLKSACYNFFFP